MRFHLKIKVLCRFTWL